MRLSRTLRVGAGALRRFGVAFVWEEALATLSLRDVSEAEFVKQKYYRALCEADYPEELRRWYRETTGERLDLEHPRTFNEKIQWLKLHDTTPLKTQLADKYLARDWVAGRIGEEYLIPLIGAWDTFDEIPFGELPGEFVLKANHGSGWNALIPDKAACDRAALKRKFDHWMRLNYAMLGGLELQYRDIPPKIVCEAFLKSKDDREIRDYKIFCFDGEPHLIQVDLDRHSRHRRNLYDPDWNYVDAAIEHISDPGRIEPAPKRLEEMLSCARSLSSGFAHARVDLYLIEGRVLFGEITFTHGSGVEWFSSRKLAEQMGDWIKMPM